MSLEGQVGVITGATSGIGRSIALLLAKSGAYLILTGRDEVRGQNLVSEIENIGGSAKFFPSDLKDKHAPRKIFQKADSVFGSVDFLVNNGGMLVHGVSTDFSDESWEEIMDVNLSSAFRMSREAVLSMAKKRGGRILNIASDWALKGAQGSVAYCVSKAALAQLTRCMALDHARDNIRINAICPGDTDTPMINLEYTNENREERLKLLGNAIPLGRVAEPEEIASVARFLLSEESSYMTGVLLPVDGGTTAQ
ncbi:MAG: SDR family oxidoreductase [Cellvibrionaceae bacterium]|nr:SDR family oxidoreductase [Cellvibrionaceae bacterium]